MKKRRFWPLPLFSRIVLQSYWLNWSMMILKMKERNYKFKSDMVFLSLFLSGRLFPFMLRI